MRRLAPPRSHALTRCSSYWCKLAVGLEAMVGIRAAPGWGGQAESHDRMDRHQGALSAVKEVFVGDGF